MQLNPNTKLSNLLRAIPSAALVCHRFHIQIRDNEDKSLELLCTEANITFSSFMRALENLDWSHE